MLESGGFLVGRIMHEPTLGQLQCSSVCQQRQHQRATVDGQQQASTVDVPPGDATLDEVCCSRAHFGVLGGRLGCGARVLETLE